MTDEKSQSEAPKSFRMNPVVDELHGKQYRWYENLYFGTWGLLALIGLPIALIVLAISLIKLLP